MARGPGRPPTPPEAIEGAPRLHASDKSVKRCIAWAWEMLASGTIPQAQAKILLDAAGKMGTQLARERNATELNELRELVRRAEVAAEKRAGLATEGRFAQDDDAGQFGKYQTKGDA